MQRSMRGAILCGALLHAVAALAQEAVIAPGPNLRADGIPPIPASLASRIALYTEFRPKSAAAWHPVKRELLVVTRAGNTVQLHRLAEPGGKLAQLTDFADPVRSGSFEPKQGAYVVFGKDTGGSEATQVYRLDPDGKSTQLTDPNLVHSRGEWNRAGDRFAMVSTQLDKTGRREQTTAEISIVNPAGNGSLQKIASLPGTWGGLRFSPDDKRLLLARYFSNTASEVWEMVIATGERKRLLPASGESKSKYGDVHYTPDGKAVLLMSNADSEFEQLIRYDLATDASRALTRDFAFDVGQIAVSRKTGMIAIITNEAGRGVLRLLDSNGKERSRDPLRALPPGMVSSPRWHENGVDLAFNLQSAQQAGDVYSLDVQTGAVTRWTETRVEGIDTSRFRDAESISWPSFDGLKITGFIYRPPSTHSGKRPLLINIHGGPESQARPGFLSRSNYFINDLGIAMIYPNVRGSSGFGKTFASLDDGMKREDSVKDIGALLDWIATQPDLDPNRVVVMGGSYGGYMALAVSVHYADRIAGAIDSSGTSNFVTFLERTETYRRDNRRAEYGDERDPAMKAFLEKISPLTSAHKIAKPLFVIQGRNDPRVPWQEADQIVTSARLNKIPVWYLLAEDEGHGFAKKNNADFQFYAMIRFAEEILLKQP